MLFKEQRISSRGKVDCKQRIKRNGSRGIVHKEQIDSNGSRRMDQEKEIKKNGSRETNQKEQIKRNSLKRMAQEEPNKETREGIKRHESRKTDGEEAG